MDLDSNKNWIRLTAHRPMLIACLPPFLLGAAWLAGFAAEQRKENFFQKRIGELKANGFPIDSDTGQDWYQRTADGTGTTAWMDVFHAVSGKNKGLDSISLPYLDSARRPSELKPGGEWKDEPQVAEYLDGMRPLLKHLEAHLTAHPHPVSLPIEFSRWGIWQLSEDSQRSLIEMLCLETEHAMVHSDSERALKAIATMRLVDESLYSKASATSWRSSFVKKRECDMIRRSLSIELWSAEQAERLLEQVKHAFNFLQNWQYELDGERACALDNFATAEKERQWSRELLTPSNNPYQAYGFPMPAIGAIRLSASTKLKVLDYFDRGKAIATDNFAKFRSRAAEIDKEFGLQEDGSNFRDFSFRALGINRLADKANWVIKRENDRRFTLTALGVKLFHLQHDRWPKQLSDLADIGFTEDDWTTTYRHRLGYEIVDGAAVVWSYPETNWPRDKISIAENYASIKFEPDHDPGHFVARIR